MAQETQCDNCGERVVPLPDQSCPVCDRLILLPDDLDESDMEENMGPTPLHFVARCTDDHARLRWGSSMPYGVILLINIICFQFEGGGERVFIVSGVAVLMSIYCTRAFYRGLSELAARVSPQNAFWEGAVRTTLALVVTGVIAAIGSVFFYR